MTAEKQRRNEYIKMFRKYPELLRIEQLCEALGGVSIKTGYKLLQEKKIDSLKVGREYRVTKVDLINYLMK
ncbi:MAG: helix-turn-helix domain-containing protein [Oscillospiraceae bacterium]|nr:helix-turn-helix domain-containing protein [Oscillospiraceae bacterium]